MKWIFTFLFLVSLCVSCLKAEDTNPFPVDTPQEEQVSPEPEDPRASIPTTLPLLAPEDQVKAENELTGAQTSEAQNEPEGQALMDPAPDTQDASNLFANLQEVPPEESSISQEALQKAFEDHLKSKGINAQNFQGAIQNLGNGPNQLQIPVDQAQNEDTEGPEEDIFDIRPMVKLPHSIGYYLTWILSVLTFLFLIFYFIRKQRAKRAQMSLVPPDPYGQALAGLEKAHMHIQADSAKLFVNLLTDALRQYFSDVFHLPAPESTTEELVECLQKTDCFSDDLKMELVRFLQECDLAKFTKQPLLHNERNLLYLKARQILDQAEKEHQQQIQQALQANSVAS